MASQAAATTPNIIYRSDLATNHFPKPESPGIGNFGHIPPKSPHDVYGTSLSKVLHTVGLQIRDLLKARNVCYTSIDAACFVTVTHGPPLMRVVRNHNPTAHVRRIFTAALNILLATREKEAEAGDSQGSLTLFFHEKRTSTATQAIRGLSNYVCANDLRRFQQGLNDIKSLIRGHGTDADFYARELVSLEENRSRNMKDEKALRYKHEHLREEEEAIAELGEFYGEVKNQWSDLAITVDLAGGTRYREDWGTFELDEAKVKAVFEGTTVDLGE
ncbi:hypothetical protein C0993_009453 [Termitomyces sp. T159_Od127]|nr:hypothetical protein C0993_009453 [Termitomyces sp. T159_Od127]